MTENKDELNEIFAKASTLFDKSSSEYKKATVENGIKRSDLENEAPDPLPEALTEANHLEESVKQRYIECSRLYTQDLQNNIFRNQFELNQAYPKVSIDQWNDFLNDRIVSTYISKHKRTLLKSAAEDNLANPLAKNKRDNLQLIKNIEEQEQTDSKKNICIIRIPDIYDEEVK
jgi:hypothetical protein